MLVFYILLTTIIYPISLIAPLFSKKANAFLTKRKLDKSRIRNFRMPEKINRVVWLHSASVGELDQCKALAKSIKQNEEELGTFIIQSVFSDSVHDKNFDTENTDLTFRLPLDFYFGYDFIFEKFHPDSLVLMAWDTWPNLVLAAERYHCKVFLASAVFDLKSKRSSFFAHRFTKIVFSKLAGISTVNESMILPFQELAGKNIKIIALGDSRFDSVVDKIKSKVPDPKFTGFAKEYLSNPILILASTYKECDSIVLTEIESILELGYSVLIFPHKVDTQRIQEILTFLRERKLPVSLYSEVKNPCKDRIILFDALGILAFAYFYGKIAYVGGAVHNKLHNVLEPAYFGLALITGDRIFNSFDAVKLKEKESLKTVNSNEEFLEAVRNYSEGKNLERLSAINSEYVLSHLGASLTFYNAFLKK